MSAGKLLGERALIKQSLARLKISQTYLPEDSAHKKSTSYHYLCAKEGVSRCAEIARDTDICLYVDASIDLGSDITDFFHFSYSFGELYPTSAQFCDFLRLHSAPTSTSLTRNQSGGKI